MTISLGLLLHANSPFSWSFEPAYHSSYQPVVDIIDEFEINVNWHFSAPLLQMINWKYPGMIDTLIQGIESGKYEILSSSYAQNVMYATSDWANHHQLVTNKEIVRDIFATEAVGFWNPERVWSDRFIDWLVDLDYQYTFIENKILRPNDPNDANCVFRRDVDGTGLYYLPDNQQLLRLFDHAIWTGEFEDLIAYLRAINSKYDNAILIYAQDIEIIGYWQLTHETITSEQVYNNFRDLLCLLQKEEWIEFQTFTEMIKSHEAKPIGRLSDGQASWMVESVKHDGYSDYFDYLETAPEIEYYHNLFGKIEKKLKQYQDYEDTQLYQEALQVYLSHQFEFGCAPASMGYNDTRYLLNVPGRMILEGSRLTTFLLSSLEEPKYKLEWKYLGNHPVIVFSNEDLYSVWTPYGARCILLVDREKMTTISPNPYFYNIGNSVAELELPSPKFEFAEIGSSIIHGGTLLSDSLEINDEEIGMQARTKRVFSQHGSHDEYSPSLPHNYFDTQIVRFDNKIKFWIQLGPYLIMKQVSIIGKEIKVNYRLTSESEYKDMVKLGITNEVSPSPNEVLVGGTNSLEINLGTTDYSISNLMTGAGLNINPSIFPTSTDVIEAIFAKRLSLYFTSKLSSSHPIEFDIKLSLL